jgi:branched-chain amino acid aminotransferase
MKMIVNGNIVSFESATVHLMTSGMRYGLNAFEGIRGYWNPAERVINIFRLSDHLSRLWRSMKILRFNPTFHQDELTTSLVKLIRTSDLRENCQIRVCAYVEGFGDHTDMEPISYFIYASALPRAVNVSKGIRCVVSSWVRISDKSMPPRVKTGANYVNVRLARIQAKQDGYDDAILLNSEGCLSEGPGAAVFLVTNGRLITPAVTNAILEGITRDTILELARSRGLTVEERSVDRTECYTAEEMFFAGTAAEVVPIINVDGLSVGGGIPGRVTRLLQSQYFGVVEGREIARSNWLLPVTLP